MAIFHCSVKAHSRSKGESATGAAAYRLGINLVDEQTGLRHDYTRRQDIAAAFTLLPENAPEGWSDPVVLWNEAEKAEKRKNSCVSREVLVALPAELTDPQREELARSIAGELVARYGVGLSVGIHRPDDGGQNHHAHILLTTRRLTPEGLGEKTRELDDQKQGPGQVEAIRQMVAEQTNEHLQRHGHEIRVDHRSLADQKQEALDNGDLERAAELSREPTKHRGRNPEVARRIASENEATKEANHQTQAEAREVFARIEAEAKAQARLQPPASDSPKSKQAQEAEAKEQRQKEQKTEAWAAVVATKKQENDARQVAFDATADELASKRRVEAFETQRNAEKGGRVAWLKTAQAEDATCSRWRKDHPLRARLGWEPKPVKKAERKAQEARRLAEEAKERATKAEALRVKEVERVAKLEVARVEAKQVLADAAAARKEAEDNHEAVKRRHARENLTPEQREAKRVQDAQALAWAHQHLGTTQAQQAPQQAPQQQQRQRQRDRGNDWGMGM